MRDAAAAHADDVAVPILGAGIARLLQREILVQRVIMIWYLLRVGSHRGISFRLLLSVTEVYAPHHPAGIIAHPGASAINSDLVRSLIWWRELFPTQRVWLRACGRCVASLSACGMLRWSAATRGYR